MLSEFSEQISGFDTAIDLGAGIGRVSKTTLLKHFSKVDLVEPSSTQIERARVEVPEIRRFYQCGLQEFEYEDGYDCVWLQWCAMYLTDEDLLKFLHKTRRNLRKVDQKSGLLFVKENVHEDGFLLDKDDCSIMRTTEHFIVLFEQAGFDVLKSFKQEGMPDDIHSVSCFVLRPSADNDADVKL